MRALAAFLGVVVVGVVVWLLWPKPAPVVEPAQPAPAPKAAPAAPAAPAIAPVKAPEPKPVTGPVVAFPDGSTAPALNGVKETVKILWNNRPYSPIKEKIVDQGREWYVHEDGTHSTVFYQDVNGEKQAVGVVATPTDPLPVREGPEAGRPKK